LGLFHFSGRRFSTLSVSFIPAMPQRFDRDLVPKEWREEVRRREEVVKSSLPPFPLKLRQHRNSGLIARIRPSAVQ
jgi:hypothetical protein